MTMRGDGPNQQRRMAPQVADARTAPEAGEHRSPRASRTRRARGTGSELDSWVSSRDGVVAHERALEDLATGRVQRLDHAEFLEAHEVELVPASIEWTVTDEFSRRYGRLRGRSHRAVAAALAALIGDLARVAPNAPPKGRPGLQLRRLPPDSPVPAAWALSWSTAGRATYLLEWRRSGPAFVPHVTWLAIGPHGAPDRRRWRGNA